MPKEEAIQVQGKVVAALANTQFKVRLERHLTAGNQWIAHFDLAAFYETISHRALQKVVAPAGGGGEIWQLIREWLCTWTSVQGGIQVDHGIPQGPMASDFLRWPVDFFARLPSFPLKRT